jgi:hypothetical protein
MTDMKDSTGKLQQYRNRTSYIGMYLAAAGLVLILFTTVIDWLQEGHSSYVGLILIFFAGMVLLGGTLILFGAWRSRHARADAVPEKRLNLNEPADRRKFYLLFFGGALLLNIAVFATYSGYRYTETSTFCGALCHTMTPEYTAYKSSPHAHVDCVECHVGPGVSYYLKYKLAGVRQLVALLLDTYAAPIPTPVENLRPARAVCEHCHWPGKFFGTKLVQRPWFHADAQNTPEQITLGVKIGGRLFHSIHYSHINGIRKMEYAARDRREQDIPWVSVTRLDGSIEEYLSLDYKGPTGKFVAEARVFDCIGCHNRPAHIFHSPDWVTNVWLAANLIPRDLPWIKKVAVEALSKPYPDRKQAHAGISSAITGFYGRQYPELATSRKRDIEQTVAAVTGLYDRNVFPEMKVNWQTHIDNGGHRDWPGCFRCHDGRHVTKSGTVLSRECTLCHTMPVRGPLQPLGVMTECTSGAEASWHPLDLSGKHGRIFCSRCHLGGDPPPATCIQCHHIDPKSPMIDQGCDACHQTPQEVTGMTACTDCHSPTGLHTVSTHAKTPCIRCHKPHQWLITGRETCIQCHGDKKGHNPGGACMTCHAFK